MEHNDNRRHSQSSGGDFVTMSAENEQQSRINKETGANFQTMHRPRIIAEHLILPQCSPMLVDAFMHQRRGELFAKVEVRKLNINANRIGYLTRF